MLRFLGTTANNIYNLTPWSLSKLLKQITVYSF